MTLTKTKDGKTYELIRFPMKTMTITQGNNGQYSHQGVNALDIAGKDAGIDPTFAPCSMRYKWHDSAANGNAIFFESVNKVMFADGTIDYATFMFIHDNYIGDILALANKGHVFAQWEEFGDEGTAGRATGNHCHFEVAKGRYSRPYDGPNRYGVYCLHNSISADRACVVDGVTIRNGNGMDWKKASQVSTGKQWTRDCILKEGEKTKSVSVQIGAWPGTNNAIKSGKVYIPALGNGIPMTKVTEAGDTRDGKCDNYLANTNAKVIVDECTVEAVDKAKNKVMIHGVWVNPGPLMGLR